MSIEISEAEFERILAEKRQLNANLTACQKQCNDQLEELRRLRFKVAMSEAGPSPLADLWEQGS